MMAPQCAIMQERRVYEIQHPFVLLHNLYLQLCMMHSFFQLSKMPALIFRMGFLLFGTKARATELYIKKALKHTQR